MYSLRYLNLTIVLFITSCGKILVSYFFILYSYRTYTFIAFAQLLTGPWSCETCNDESYQNKNLDSTARWDYAHANDTLNAIIDTWYTAPNPNKLNFSNAVSNYFGVSSDIECGSVNEGSNCRSDNTCFEPPGFDAVFGSFVWLNNVSFRMLFYSR